MSLLCLFSFPFSGFFIYWENNPSNFPAGKFKICFLLETKLLRNYIKLVAGIKAALASSIDFARSQEICQWRSGGGWVSPTPSP